MKKLAAILLVIVLVLSVGITAYADTPDGTITVNGAVDGQEYNLYKIFDITTVNGADAYSVPTGKDYSETANFSTLFETNTTSGVIYVTRKSTAQNADIIAWAKANVSSFGTAVATETAANAKVEFTGLADGYYYVASPVSNGAAAMIAHASQTATVVEKNSAPSWDDGANKGGKEANGETFYAGDTITYTVTYYGAVNYDGGNQVTKYIIEDILPAGITYNNNVSATVNGASVALTSEADVTNGFKVSIPWTSNGASIYTKNPSTIVVTYTATMGNTVIASAITNTAKVYPDTNANPGTETEKEDTVYTGQIVLTKVDNSDNSKVLSGAKFKVKVGEKYLKQDGDTFSEVDAANADVFETDVNGKITLTGLKAASYTFVEIEAPAGYNLPDNTEIATVELKVDGTMNDETVVANSKAAAMPETGGMGTTMFYVFGSLLAIGAVILLITKKRMGAVQ